MGLSMTSKSVAIIGGGAWGSALASQVSANGHNTRILTRRDDLARQLSKGVSPALDGMAITAPHQASTDPKAVVGGADAVIVVVPVAATEETLKQIKPYLAENIPVAFAAKGFEPKTDELIPHYASALIDNPIVMLSGPTFADEVTQGLPAAMVAASDNNDAAHFVANLFKGSSLRVYTSDDPVGVAVGGAVKNVIAIASGIIAGLELGDNARAAILTRGLAEATRLAVAMGGRKETLFGLAGLGDMTLTCSGPHSRNFAFGLALVQGTGPTGKLAEGQHSCTVIARRAEHEGIQMPITAAVDRVVSGQSSIKEEINGLMERPVDSEWST